MLSDFIILILSFFFTYIFVEFFRRWTLKKQLLAIPNERSSHKSPIPNSGGLIIFVIFISALVCHRYLNDKSFLIPYIVGACIVSVISFLDDLKDISPFLRLFFHLLAAIIPIWFFGGFNLIYIPFYGSVNIGNFGYIVAFLWIVWLINVYNFMDGIDGIAILQAFVAGILWCFVGLIWKNDLTIILGSLLAIVSVGFLIHNWHPAKIFMGDVGSAFLGYTFAVFPLMVKSEESDPQRIAILPWLSILFVWLFVFDMTFTSIKRTLRGEKLWHGAREHIYQKLVILGYSHDFVAAIYGFLSLILGLVVLTVVKYGNQFDIFVIIISVFEIIFLFLFWQYKSRISRSV